MPNFIVLFFTSIISPVGNLIGKITSPYIWIDSLQWINVSSKSNTIVFLLVEGKLIFLSSKLLIIFTDFYKTEAYFVFNNCSLIESIGFVMSIYI